MKLRLSVSFLIVIFVFPLVITNHNKQHHKKQHHKKQHHEKQKYYKPPKPFQKKICLKIDHTLKAQHKSCFLRPDTGPCRADIIQWYYDVRQTKCYRFFWGGCQGNGNRFENREDCENYCKLNITNPIKRIPYFCSLTFDYGTCFGYFNRWTWDDLSKTCRRRLYSGCGGNQNNFHSRTECLSTCLNAPNNTLQRSHMFTTCIPIVINDIQ